ncbi:MAG: PHP domain-containing protein [Pseudomonadota bacterium]
MKYFKADLHIHTCLSPCGDWEMTPSGIIKQAFRQDLDIIAICDHNTAENVAATMQAGMKAGIRVLAGMEVCSKEEVHLLGIFDRADQALALQTAVYNNLEGENRPEVFGFQVIAGDNNEALGENPRRLIGATLLSIYEIAAWIHRLGGICIASHVDRPYNSIISQLGFIPSDMLLDGIEVSRLTKPGEAGCRIPGIERYPCIRSSDAHFIDDIGAAWSAFFLESPSVREIQLALRGKDNRKVF